MLTLKRMTTLLIPYHLVVYFLLVTMRAVLISFPTFSANNATSTNSTSSGSNGGHTKSGALAGVMTNIGGLITAVVLGVLAITL
jgi:hypothetical protein